MIKKIVLFMAGLMLLFGMAFIVFLFVYLSMLAGMAGVG